MSMAKIAQLVERQTSNLKVRGSNPPRGRNGTLQKNAEFFLLIEKTLGNVSPCFELAFSLSFKELGSRNLKAKL